MADFYLFFGLIAGVGACTLGLTGNSPIIEKWFTERLGLSAGITTTGIGLGMLVFVPPIKYCFLHQSWLSTFIYKFAFNWNLTSFKSHTSADEKPELGHNKCC